MEFVMELPGSILLRNVLEILQGFDKNQPRGKDGRWTATGSAGGKASDTGTVARRKPVGESEKTLHTALEQHAGWVAGNFPKTAELKYKGSHDMVLKEGKWYEASGSTKLPKGVKRGEAKGCYRNAANLAMDNPDYTYVEGFASIDMMPGFPIQHAWVVDKKGKVIDNTWKTDGVAYVGIPFKTSFLRETITKTRTWGLIPEIPTSGYNPMKNGFPEGAIEK